MKSVPKVATPFTAATVAVPPSVAPLVPVPAVSATVTIPVNLGTGLPNASSAVTFSAGVICPAVAAVGWTVNASCVGPLGPAVSRLQVDSSSENIRTAPPGCSQVGRDGKRRARMRAIARPPIHDPCHVRAEQTNRAWTGKPCLRSRLAHCVWLSCDHLLMNSRQVTSHLLQRCNTIAVETRTERSEGCFSTLLDWSQSHGDQAQV